MANISLFYKENRAKRSFTYNKWKVHTNIGRADGKSARFGSDFENGKLKTTQKSGEVKTEKIKPYF